MVNTSPSGARRAGWSAEAAAAPAAAMGAAGPTRPAFVGSTYRRAPKKSSLCGSTILTR